MQQVQLSQVQQQLPSTTNIINDKPSSEVANPEVSENVKNTTKTRKKSRTHWILIILSIAGMMVGFVAGSLLLRFYFAQGGSRKWFSTFIQTAGWPIPAVAMGVVYWKQGIRLAPFTGKLIAGYTLLGSLSAFDNFLYAWGLSYLPASTSALLTSSQLVFNAIFALLITRQKISAYGWNSVVLVVSSAVLLALHSTNDRPPGVTQSQFVLGYILTVLAAALYGFIYPLTELLFNKIYDTKSNYVVLEMQTFVSIIATLVTAVGMAINKDFAAIPKEASSFKSGPTAYYMSVIFGSIAWQAGLLGSLGIIFLSSSLLAGVVLASSIPFASLSAVIFFHDSFGGLKIMSMLLCLWGFTSYIYGGYVDSKIKKNQTSEDLPV